jgi:flagellar protein FliS
MALSNSRHRSAASGYLRVRSESLTQHSTPQELILLVYEALLDRLVKCEGHISADEFVAFDSEILKAMKLIQYGLRDALSFELGGDVAVSLDRTYSVWMLALDFLAASRSGERLASLTEDVRGVRDAWVAAFGGAIER